MIDLALIIWVASVLPIAVLTDYCALGEER